MRFSSLVLPVAALGAAAMLLAPAETQAFTTIGGSLGQSQRHFRVFNNFTDNAANANTQQTSNWPGYDGAELAIWKACVEWASTKHGGTGAGDPHQWPAPAGLGSGKADFDPVWQGNASTVGGTNDNIHSELAGNGGGVLAFCETPISNGWRIRYYANWTWQDGPEESQSGTDLQGVACHEYGHALGLGHSSGGLATMFPSISGTGNGQRSIFTDDKDGVKFVYGTKSANKPEITDISGTSTLTIIGFNFAATGNRVWFTPSGITNSGVPIKVTNLASTNGGTQITVNLPAGAGAGDVFVRQGGNSGHSGLSNGWPFDPSAPPCGIVSNYCTAGTSASGCTPTLSTSGTPSATAATGFVVSASGIEGNKDGLFFFGTNGKQSTSWGNGTSFQCVIPPVIRTGLQLGNGSSGFCDGSFSQDLTAVWAAKPSKNPGVGAQVQMQLWYRDPQNTSNQTTSLSDAIEFEVCP